MAKQKGLVLLVPTGYHYNPMVMAAKAADGCRVRLATVEYMLCHIGSALRNLYTGQAWPYTLDSIPDPKSYYSDPEDLRWGAGLLPIIPFGGPPAMADRFTGDRGLCLYEWTGRSGRAV